MAVAGIYLGKTPEIISGHDARLPQAKSEKLLAHREGRTRSLQIRSLASDKSLTLYPIELGGRHGRPVPDIHVL
jgi:hypothetical protein